MAFACSFDYGGEEFFDWLLNNGYPELAAFSNAIRGDVEAMKWLCQHNLNWLAILSNAIDGDDRARVWIGKHCNICNLMFAMACREDVDAIRWLLDRKYNIFLMMAKEVATVLNTQALENQGPYVLHF